MLIVYLYANWVVFIMCIYADNGMFVKYYVFLDRYINIVCSGFFFFLKDIWSLLETLETYFPIIFPTLLIYFYSNSCSI